MRISDWSSDVCSSDLHDILRARHHRLRGELDRLLRRTALAVDRHRGDRVGELRGEHRVAADVHRLQIGRASCRERVLSVRVDLGGRRIIKKKRTETYNVYSKPN